MAKNISKSIRITEEVFAYIDRAPGKGFNEKLSNIILEAKQEEAKRRKKLDGLQNSIEQKRRELGSLIEKTGYMDEIYRKVLSIQRQLYDLKEHLDKVMDEPEPSRTDNT